ncbi:uncharacterized protein SPAPADRAFT_141183 [Spathaspora passalidarum NRRL Y-27907]|uniref:SPX domain-containing protein n=1 Tax=Spathaspora passalidarum (strain NRRL Y-27907 / 11-Y1) TaxID=619300 RepID=G3ARQ1_SPAPN|nr:uncharacterized protein SPAPADRAFT_141183 [Spathaspora passalidarum NRRL Y-27907]EGW31804.1 hypothetical protein SPAPADRAFT_141183 [Spathaspora passalidarum NRRL Y-27907]
MKFGNNLQHLSIPEWKSYNIDYNDLKYQIREITQTKSTNLDSLHQSFVDNFDYINLFIQTKYGELIRKFDYYELCLQKIVKSCHQTDDDLRNCLVEVDEIFYQIIEISIVLKNLSKFVVIQKIAIKKIFKKLLKYYPVKNQSLKFILELKSYLVKNPNSLINFDLSPLTMKITNSINQIKNERKRLNSLVEGNSVGLARKTSMFSISSTLLSDTYYQNSIFSKSLPHQKPPQLQPHQHDNLTLESNFDLSVYLKKNFQSHALIPQDSNTMNDLILNFSIYLNLKNLSSTDLISYTYLMSEEEEDIFVEPSVIISSNSQENSLIIAHIGGLRKYSYCYLPNDIVQLFIHHLNDRENEEYKNRLIEYFQTHQVNHLTKKTIDHITSHNLVPKLKLFSKRSRYIINEDEEPGEENSEDGDDHSLASGYPDNHYLITLDSEISTTNNQKYVNDLTFPENHNDLDPFPHNHLAVYSNDIKLLNFEDSIETKINIKDQVIRNKYSSSCMRNLPKKIQSILTNNSLTLFKGLNFYQYQLSCYYNVIPDGKYVNNHYTNLLEINLLKNYENIESLNNQLSQENDLIKQKSRRIIEHKMSIKSLNTPTPSPDDNQKNSFGSSVHNSIFDEPGQANGEELSISPNELLRFNDETLLTGDEDDEDYGIYFEIPEPARDSSLNAFIDTLLNFKNRLFKKIEKKKKQIRFKQAENPFFYHNEEEQYLDPYTKLLACYHNSYHSPYDSINEEPPSYFHRNDFQIKYQLEYDQTLSYIYFSLNLIALFLSGIQLGIIYSIFDNSNQDHHFLIVNNIGLMIILILGIALSLIFSLISVNLMFYRYTPIPHKHQIISWSVFVIVALCCGWAGGLIIFNF